MVFRSHCCTRYPRILLWVAGCLVQPLIDVCGQEARQRESQAPEELQAVYFRYQKESLSPIKDRPAFFKFWENEFKSVLSNSNEVSVLGIRMLDELGAIQRNLGKPDEAARTYDRMAAAAKKANDLESRLIAAENRFDLATKDPIGSYTNSAKAFRELAEDFVHQRDAERARQKLANALMQIGVSLLARGKLLQQGSSPKELGTVADSAALFEEAEKVFKEAAALGEVGASPLASKLCYLGQSQSLLGKRHEAAATYGVVAGMDQDVISRLRVEYLRICELTAKDTDEYRVAIAKALEDQAGRGDTDEYEAILRHELGISFQKAKQYGKSTEVLNANLGKGNDSNVNAYEMLLISQNYASLGDRKVADDLLKAIVKDYPDTGTAKAVEALLKSKLGSSSLKTRVVRIGLVVAVLLIPLVIFLFGRMNTRAA
jgi:tetratricopeptide (TPR) repeat protein